MGTGEEFQNFKKSLPQALASCIPKTTLQHGFHYVADDSGCVRHFCKDWLATLDRG